MIQNSRKKICIVADCLSKGGAEKAAGILSQVLQNSGNYEVTIISFRDDVTYPYAGTLINIGKNESKFKLIKQIQKFFRLKKSINKVKADYIIDFRTRNRVLMEGLLHLFVWESKKMVFTIHSYNVNWHLPKGKFFIKYYKKGKLVAVSKSIKSLLKDSYGFRNAAYIPNIVIFDSIKKLADKNLKIEDEFIIAVGRLRNDIKQFDKLIKVYSNTNLIDQNIKLYILGDGPDKTKLQNLIEKLKLKDHVKLLGLVGNPYPYLKQAMFKVLCSKFEGLPMVILEALTLKTPVISFDCNSGPSEMITHNKNGILVPDQDFNTLRKTIEYLANNKKVLNSFEENTDKNPEIYSEENHLKNWVNILQ